MKGENVRLKLITDRSRVIDSGETDGQNWPAVPIGILSQNIR
jgi:hypothetical protein